MIFSILTTLFLQATSMFWNYWGDGKAEIATYETIQNRYGSDRKATVVLIYVTEPFNLEKQIKSDTYNFENPNHAQIFKLNMIKDFQTGIYDYNIMTSIFTSIDPFELENKKYEKGTAVKISFSSQEWCGNAFQQLNRHPEGIRSCSYSYFEKAANSDLILPADTETIFADNLFIAVRELIKPLPTGQVKIYPSLEYVRLFHQPLKISNGFIGKQNETYPHNKKQLAVTKFNIDVDDQTWVIIVEEKYPRKILYFEHKKNNKVISSGKHIKSARLPYWQLNKLGDENFLKDIGL